MNKQEKHTFYQLKKTMLHYRIRKWGMVFLFVLFVPGLAAFMTGESGTARLPQAGDSLITLTLTSPGGNTSVSLEEYLCGLLPCVIPVDYEPECLKAQAIVLRTYYVGRYQELMEAGGGELTEPEDSYMTGPELAVLWGADYYNNSEKIRQAVTQTRGIYITYEGKPIHPCYFRVSCGRTRDGGETLGPDFPYLKSTVCPSDYQAESYLSHFSFKKSELLRILGGSPGELIYDSAGYCTCVTLVREKEKTYISGEAFREKLNLPSAAFTLAENDGNFLFTVKGEGHGLGFGQFAAHKMAEMGSDYNVILSYFFQNIALDKYE